MEEKRKLTQLNCRLLKVTKSKKSDKIESKFYDIERVRHMRLSVRLARETIEGISELKDILENESQYSGLRLTNGFVVGIAYEETKDINWEKVIEAKRVPKNNVDKKSLEIKTNLVLRQDVFDGINDLKKVLPQFLSEVSYVTTSYAIRIMVRAALLKRENILDENS